jgi:ABC-2 type transport system permease protein
MSDILTMIWKEVRDSIFSGGRGELIRPLLFIAILGGLLPWQLGAGWLSMNGAVIFVSAYIPFFQTIAYIGDAIAGERERHTLETLLASRISDRAILLGKLIVAVAYAWIMTFIGLMLGLVVANLTSGNGACKFYSPISTFLEQLLFIVVISLLSASGGVLVSLRSPTVRQAQQTMTVGTMILFFGGFFVLRSLPQSALASLNSSNFLPVMIGVIALLDLILLGILFAGFRRSRLILS